MNFLDYVIASAVLVWLIVAVCYIIRQKKAGRSSCGGCCSGCQKHCHQTGVKR